MTILQGCIADDSTGGTDVALMLAQNGMDVVQILGAPRGGCPEADAIVISLKTRTIPAATASDLSVAAARYLLDCGAGQLLFKYCSTFDSTDRGNIGPVASSLLDLVGSDFTIFCPAFPANGRTVRDGYLFVEGRPLSESSMRHHPLTPMRDSNLVRVLERQSARGAVGLIPLAVVEEGPEAVRRRSDELRRRGHAFAVVDAVTDDDLMTIGTAFADLPLITGSSGIARGLPENFRRAGRLPPRRPRRVLPAVGGPVAILAGSCSETTLGQVDAARSRFPVVALKPLEVSGHPSRLDDVRDQALEAMKHSGAVLVTSSAPPAEVREVQEALGAGPAGELIEEAMARLAFELVGAGVRKLIVAGGETSGAIAEALEIRQLRIGPEIDPGVPWTIRVEDPEMLIALKSGNFGSPDFFHKAVEMVA